MTSNLAEDAAAPNYDFLSVIPALKNIFSMSGSSIIGLPTSHDGYHLVHRQDIVTDFPTHSEGKAMPWDDYIARLKEFNIDRDGDNIVDSPLCVVDACNSQTSLLHFISTSIFQIHGQCVALSCNPPATTALPCDVSCTALFTGLIPCARYENHLFDAATMEPLVESPAFLEVLRIYYELWKLVDKSDPSCQRELPIEGSRWQTTTISSGGYPGTLAADQYANGRCIAMFGYLLNEPIPSYSTAVGSSVVHAVSRANVASGSLLSSSNGDSTFRTTTCLSVLDCPRSLPSSKDNSRLVNPAAYLMFQTAVHAIDKRSLRKDEACASRQEVSDVQQRAGP